MFRRQPRFAVAQTAAGSSPRGRPGRHGATWLSWPASVTMQAAVGRAGQDRAGLELVARRTVRLPHRQRRPKERARHSLFLSFAHTLFWGCCAAVWDYGGEKRVSLAVMPLDLLTLHHYSFTWGGRHCSAPFQQLALSSQSGSQPAATHWAKAGGARVKVFIWGRWGAARAHDQHRLFGKGVNSFSSMFLIRATCIASSSLLFSLSDG